MRDMLRRTMTGDNCLYPAGLSIELVLRKLPDRRTGLHDGLIAYSWGKFRPEQELARLPAVLLSHVKGIGEPLVMSNITLDGQETIRR